MTTVLIVAQIIVALALIGVVLVQKSEGGALGMGGGGMSGFMSGRSTANFLTRLTAGLAAAFFGISIALAIMANSQRAQHGIDFGPASAPATAPIAPGTPIAPAQPATPAAPTAPAAPAEPSAPLAK